MAIPVSAVADPDWIVTTPYQIALHVTVGPGYHDLQLQIYFGDGQSPVFRSGGTQTVLYTYSSSALSQTLYDEWEIGVTVTGKNEQGQNDSGYTTALVRYINIGRDATWNYTYEYPNTGLGVYPLCFGVKAQLESKRLCVSTPGNSTVLLSAILDYEGGGFNLAQPVTYNWYESSTGMYGTYTLISSQTNDSLEVTHAIGSRYYYYCEIIDDNGVHIPSDVDEVYFRDLSVLALHTVPSAYNDDVRIYGMMYVDLVATSGYDKYTWLKSDEPIASDGSNAITVYSGTSNTFRVVEPGFYAVAATASMSTCVCDVGEINLFFPCYDIACNGENSVKVVTGMGKDSFPVDRMLSVSILATSTDGSPFDGTTVLAPMSLWFEAKVEGGSGNYAYDWTVPDGMSPTLSSHYNTRCFSHTFVCVDINDGGMSYIDITLSVTDVVTGQSGVSTYSLRIFSNTTCPYSII